MHRKKIGVGISILVVLVIGGIIGTVSTFSYFGISSFSPAKAIAAPAPVGGRHIGFWVAEDDIWSGGAVTGNNPPWTPQQFFNNYFMTAPYPSTLQWTTGLTPSGPYAVTSVGEAEWFGNLSKIADSYPSIQTTLLFFVDLSGYSIITYRSTHSPNFIIQPTTNPAIDPNDTGSYAVFSVIGLTPSQTYSIVLNTNLNATVVTITTFTTNSTGGYSGKFQIPNEPESQNLWYITVSGTTTSYAVALQADQTQDLTNYLNVLKGHRSIYGAQYEPEYFGNSVQENQKFCNIVTSAGYACIYGPGTANYPAIDYSEYPYLTGAIQTTLPSNYIGIGYGEVGAPLCGSSPCPAWTQTSVTNIVDNSASSVSFTYIYAEDDTNNPAGNFLLWNSTTLRGWIWNDPNYRSNYVLANSASSTTAISSTSTSTTTTSNGFPTGYSPVDIVTQSSLPDFTCNCNWAGTQGNPTYFTVPRQTYVNVLAFFATDRAYDPNNQTVSILSPTGTTLATGTFSAYGSMGADGAYNDQWYPVQLNNVVLLQPNTRYEVSFGALPANDCFGGYANGACDGSVTNNFFGSRGPSYAGQTYYPTFEVGLMNLLPQGISYRNYDGTTDLQDSLNYNGWTEDAFMFTATQTESISSVSSEFITPSGGYPSPGNAVLQVSLRPNIQTVTAGGVTFVSPHPTTVGSQLASGSISISTIISGMQSCAGAFGGRCSWPSIPLSGNTQITAGQSYWIVFNATRNYQLEFERLVNPYNSLFFVSHSDFSSDWQKASDGPSEIPYIITTSGTTIANAVQGVVSQEPFNFGAQSFISPAAQTIKGIWLENIAPGSNSYLVVSIRPDSGADTPSSQVLARAQTPTANSTYVFNNYLSFNTYVQIAANTKYWIVAQDICTGSCSSPSMFSYVAYKAGYGGNAIHAETSTDGVSWTAVSGSAVFTLAASTGYEGATTQTSTTGTTQTSSSLASSTSGSSLGSITIQGIGGPYVAGAPVDLSGSTVSNSGSMIPSQTVYVWVNGQNQGSATSNSYGNWAFSFIPQTSGSYQVSASQNQDGSGIASQQLMLTVPSGSTSSGTTLTSSTTTTTRTFQSTTDIVTTITTTFQSTTPSTTTTSTLQSTTDNSVTFTNSLQTTTSALTSVIANQTTTGMKNSGTSSLQTTSSHQTLTSSNSKPRETTLSTSSSTSFEKSNSSTSSPSAIIYETFLVLGVGFALAAPLLVRVVKRQKNENQDNLRDWRW